MIPTLLVPCCTMGTHHGVWGTGAQRREPQQVFLHSPFHPHHQLATNRVALDAVCSPFTREPTSSSSMAFRLVLLLWWCPFLVHSPCGSQEDGSQVPPPPPRLYTLPQLSITSGRGLGLAPGTPGPLTGTLCIPPPHLHSALAQFLSLRAMFALRAENVSWGWSLASWHHLLRCSGNLGGMCLVGVWGHHLHLVGPSLGFEHSKWESHSVLRDVGGSQKVAQPVRVTQPRASSLQACSV